MPSSSNKIVRKNAASGAGVNPMCKPFGVLSRGLVLAAALLFGPVSEASERVVVGVTGTPNALAWPFYIGMEKGFFGAEDQHRPGLCAVKRSHDAPTCGRSTRYYGGGRLRRR